MMDLVRRPDFVTRMIEVSFNPILDLAERVAAEAPIDGIWVTDDLGESKGPFLSVEKYRAIYQPWHKQLVDRLHKKDSRVFLHSHGNIMPLVGQLVDCGFDSLDPFDPTDNMNLPELKSRYGDRITLTGGIAKHIGTLSPEEIDLHIKHVVETAGPYGFILNCGGGIPPEMSLEAFNHYSDTLERWRKISAKDNLVERPAADSRMVPRS